MSKPDVNTLAQQMIDAVGRFVARAESSLGMRLSDLEERLKAIPAGARGEKGETGESIRGEIGPPGPQGVPGERGADGAQGLQGSPGERGADGQRGFAEDGAPGAEGPQGPQGAPGERGAEGAVGQPGPPGESIRGEAGAPGAVGVKGDKGDVGPAGESIRGEMGPPGKDGISIHPDTVALMVRTAVEKAVAALAPAKDGAPGRDAAELTVLPGIDETRSYPAGTYAKHAGGELRAERDTDWLIKHSGDVLAAGWTVAREGLAALTVTQGDDPRVIEVAAMLTSGTKTVATLSVPMMIYRGVWRDGESESGDVCTWGGSAWHCQQKTTDKPGTSEAWRLMVKEGRPGKDGTAPTVALLRPPVRVK